MAGRRSAGCRCVLRARWVETFSDDVVAAAVIDYLVHHAEVLTFTGDSWARTTSPDAGESHGPPAAQPLA